MGERPADMTAAFVRRLGGVEEIEIGRLPTPACGPDDVLVRIEALAANAVDTFVRSGAYATRTPTPFIIGRDFVGEVVAMGERAGAFAPGERVWCNSLGYDGRQGSFAEYAAAPADRVYRLPPGADPFVAVSLLHTAATACLGLFRQGALREGERAFIGGAAGGVGSAAVQLAREAGARVVATASAADADWVRACGAQTVFDYRDPDLWRGLAEAAGPGFDLYWDNSGEHDFERALPLLACGGRLIVSAGLRARAALPAGALYTRDASLRGFAISNASVEDLAWAAALINQRLAAGALQSRIGLRLPLSEAARAHRLIEGSEREKSRGRIVVIP